MSGSALTRRTGWIVAQAAVLLLAGWVALPLPLRAGFGYLALLLPAYAFARLALPPGRRAYAPALAFPTALVLGAVVGLALQLGPGFSWGTVAGTLLLLSLAALVAPPPDPAEDRKGLLLLASVAIAVSALFSAADPNEVSFTTHDAWTTFAAVADIEEDGRIEFPGYDLTAYPRGVHFLYAMPLLLAGDASLPAMVAALAPYRVFAFLGATAMAAALGASLGFGRWSLPAALTVYLWAPGGLPSLWHLMPRAVSVSVVLAALLLGTEILRAPSRRLGALLAALAAGSLLAHPFTTAVAVLAAASMLAAGRSRAAPLAPVLAAGAGLGFTNPAVVDALAALPAIGAPVGLYRIAPDLLGFHPFALHPLPLILGLALAALLVLFRGRGGARGLALFSLLLLPPSVGLLAPERWYFYVQPLAGLLAVAAVRAVRPGFRPAAAVLLVLLVLSAALTHAAYWSWARGDSTPAEIAAVEAIPEGCTLETDPQTAARARAGRPIPVEAPRACILLTPRFTHALMGAPEGALGLPRWWSSSPAILDRVDPTTHELLHASTGRDHLLYRERIAPRAGTPEALLLAAPGTWPSILSEVLLLRLGTPYAVQAPDALGNGSFEGIDLVVAAPGALAAVPSEGRETLRRAIEAGGRLVVLGGPYGDAQLLAGVVQEDGWSEFRAFRWGGAEETLWERTPRIEVTLVPAADTVARVEGAPLVWRVASGNGTVVAGALGSLQRTEDAFRLGAAMVRLSEGGEVAAPSMPSLPIPGERPFHGEAARLAAAWRDPFLPWIPSLAGALPSVVLAVLLLFAVLRLVGPPVPRGRDA